MKGREACGSESAIIGTHTALSHGWMVWIRVPVGA
jgi:hypothetical protein